MEKSDDNFQDVDIGGQLEDVEHIDFFPLGYSAVKVTKPLEMKVSLGHISEPYKAHHTIPSLSESKNSNGEIIYGEGFTKEEATRVVFVKMQARLNSLRKEGAFPMSKQRAYLEAVLDMPADTKVDTEAIKNR